MPKERFKAIPAVYLILHRENSVLLSRRYNTGYEDGNYSLPAGHVEAGETLIQAMIREAQEEIGIAFESKDLSLVHAMYRNAGEHNERMDFFFTLEKWIGVPENREPNKCDDLQWFNVNNLPENTVPYICIALENWQRKIPFSEFGW